MMKAWLPAVLAAAALICGCQANLEGITDEDLKKLVLAEKYVVVLFCEFDNQSDSAFHVLGVALCWCPVKRGEGETSSRKVAEGKGRARC